MRKSEREFNPLNWVLDPVKDVLIGVGDLCEDYLSLWGTMYDSAIPVNSKRVTTSTTTHRKRRKRKCR